MTTLLLGSGLYRRALPARASTVSSRKTFLNLVLEGGPDMRHLIVPPYSDDSASYGYTYWSHRWRSHEIAGAPAAWQSRWESDYSPVTWQGTTFGILNKAGWLKEAFEAGNVAVISNIYASKNRDHSHSLLKLESGDLTTGNNDFGRDGWGGRLAAVLEGNVVSMTSRVRLFCNGPHPDLAGSHDNKRVISARDTRNLGLYYPESLKEDPSARDNRAVMARALSSYYQAKQDEISTSSSYYKFFQHYTAYRAFDEVVNQRLADYPVPEEILAFYEGSQRLNSTYFGEQLRNVFDSYVLSDILNFRIGSLEYGGWDSHRNQATMIEPKLADIFGTDQGLDTVFSILQSTLPADYNNMVVLIAGEFGRQLEANGDQGTDHGRGNQMFLIGPQVKGGLYGELFPTGEREKYGQPGADTDGLTSVERLYAAIAEWMQPGSAATVVPDYTNSDLESGVEPEALFSS